MKFEFTVDDFDSGLGQGGFPTERANLTPKQCAERANKILQAHLDTLPVVYQKHQTGMWSENLCPRDTHTATLFNIEEIK